ncbi:NUDIX hydrolase [Streptomyces adustus]|uniref:NUDIX hydrolase n=1 Tax=Streptomyces adustus TaxID=1609272 RepID=A0A5N8VM76_9ACTN|nr:NUDIX hydrolase [Streptomyces adustus]MPY36373.1 NUDIX hydrolase [Streptomyces adustus]
MTTDRPTPGTPAPIRRERAVEVYGSRFGNLYDDEVVFPGGSAGRYLRWQWKQQGVVVVPMGPEGLALLPMYRYPVGAVSLEFPRGGCDPGEAPEAAAARELKEESGLTALSVRQVGTLHADTGLIATQTHVCVAEVHPVGRTAARPETSESVAEPVWASYNAMALWLREGRITCAITIAAYAVAMAGTPASATAPPHTTDAVGLSGIVRQ